MPITQRKMYHSFVDLGHDFLNEIQFFAVNIAKRMLTVEHSGANILLDCGVHHLKIVLFLSLQVNASLRLSDGVSKLNLHIVS